MGVLSHRFSLYYLLGINCQLCHRKVPADGDPLHGCQALTFTRLLILIPLYVVILLLERYFYGSTDYLFAVALLAIFILGAGVIYNAKRQVEEAIAQTFFKKDYQSGVTLKSFSNEMMTILDQNELTYKIVENLSAAMELKRISLFVQDEKGDYVLAADCPERLGRGTEHEKRLSALKMIGHFSPGLSSKSG